MDLFEYFSQNNNDAPLAVRMRPEKLSDIIGQEDILGPGRLLYRMILSDRIGSLILYGPPGSGKTTIARVIAHSTKADFCQVNAASAGKKELEEIIKRARENIGGYGRKTILFIDEIHRFNKSTQDYLLPYVEDGTVILIGATTENPFFEVNGALLSRSRVFELKALSKEDIKRLLIRAMNDDKGLLGFGACASGEALDFLSDVADGDARAALNALELAVLTTERGKDGIIHIGLSEAEECIQKRVLRYDRDGDNHYDTVSAFIKSMRGSDPDAAVYYLGRMLLAGEDIKFIARRIVICASEDVGNMDPMALVVASSAFSAIERVGMPEAQIILSQAATYVASAPKSNACVEAINEAMEEVKRSGSLPIPMYLRDAHYRGAESLGRGTGYKYPHDYPGNFVEQRYLPEEIKDREFYHFPHAHRKRSID